MPSLQKLDNTTIVNSQSSTQMADELLRDAPDSFLPQSPSDTTASTPWLRILLFIALLYAVYCMGAWMESKSTNPPPVGPILSTPTASASAPGSSAATPPLLVHVAGRVTRPGVYRLPYDARVLDAIHKAGGPLKDADMDAINLAAWVEDGTRIEVPAKANSMPPNATSASNSRNAPVRQQSMARVTGQASIPVTSSAAEIKLLPIQGQQKVTDAKTKATQRNTKRVSSSSQQKSQKHALEYLTKHPVNLNTANAVELQVLPGIGPATAEKIIIYRQENGSFKTVDDLMEVKGIGEKKLEKLRAYVTVN